MAHERMKSVRDHFESEADVFDERVVKIVPHYREMLEALVDALPFPPGKPVRVADLGCGTGTVAWLVKQRFPKAALTCVDMSRNMLDLAARKLKGRSGIRFDCAGLSDYAFTGKYDAVVSSLALHHLEKAEKLALYRKIRRALVQGGAFVVADIILSSNTAIQKKYLEKWGTFVLQSFPRAQMEENYRRYLAEDRPADLPREMAALRSAGFTHTEVFWKYYNFATYGAYCGGVPGRK